MTAVARPGAESIHGSLNWLSSGAACRADEPGAHGPGADLGAYLVEPAALEYWSCSEPQSPRDLLDRLRLCGEPTAVYSAAVGWRPVTDLGQLLSVNGAALRGDLPDLVPIGRELAPAVFAGPAVRIAPRVALQGPVWVGGGSTIEAGATIHGPAWIGRGSTIGSGAELRGVLVEERSRVVAGARLADCIVTGDRVLAADGSVGWLDSAKPEADFDDSGEGMRKGLLQLATRVARSRAFQVR